MCNKRVSLLFSTCFYCNRESRQKARLSASGEWSENSRRRWEVEMENEKKCDAASTKEEEETQRKKAYLFLIFAHLATALPTPHHHHRLRPPPLCFASTPQPSALSPTAPTVTNTTIVVVSLFKAPLLFDFLHEKKRQKGMWALFLVCQHRGREAVTRASASCDWTWFTAQGS